MVGAIKSEVVTRRAAAWLLSVGPRPATWERRGELPRSFLLSGLDARVYHRSLFDRALQTLLPRLPKPTDPGYLSRPLTYLLIALPAESLMRLEDEGVLATSRDRTTYERAGVAQFLRWQRRALGVGRPSKPEPFAFSTRRPERHRLPSAAVATIFNLPR